MPTPGLSLFGFMTAQHALMYLRNSCDVGSQTDAQLLALWNTSRQNIIGGPPNAGNPQITAIPQAQNGHIQSLMTGPWQATLNQNPTWDFKLVEIAPLLAFQFSILRHKTNGHCQHLPKQPALSDLIDICLPLAPSNENLSVSHLPQSILIRGRNLNLQAIETGMIGPNALGLTFGFSVPFVHVVRFNGNCYLHNGFHRVYGAALAGATEVPCVFRDVTDPISAGIRADGATFDQALLESPDPPTMHHFVSGQATQIDLKLMSRVINVSWSDYVVPDEY